MRFSKRTPDDLTPNAITRERDGNPHPIWDLTQSNPTLCGFHYPVDLLRGLSSSKALLYEPNAWGMPQTREILARHLSSRGEEVQADHLLLTASTSEAYSYLFKLLGNPGDQILVPSPGYPLLEHLLALEAMQLVPYHLQKKPHWPVDWTSLESGMSDKARALVTVNPHNPTGTFLSSSDQEALLDLCARESIAYISDEVFGDFAYEPKSKFNQRKDVLSFHLGGFSKSLGLPQLKLAWINIQGPPQEVLESKNRLELIADTYLSVNTPVQCAIADLLTFAPDIQQQIKTRVLQNRHQLEKDLSDLPYLQICPSQGGWYALVEIFKAGVSDEDLAIRILKTHQVLVHPGWLYDFRQGCFLVLSLLPPLDYFQTASYRLRKFLEGLT